MACSPTPSADRRLAEKGSAASDAGSQAIPLEREYATRLIEPVFAGDVICDAASIDYARSDLLDAEAALVDGAIESRQREFATGRVLARRAMRALGEARTDATPLLRDADRVPLWPAGIVGSISHTRGLCAVVVGRRDDYRGLGLDVEPAEPVRRGIDAVVCSEAERRWVSEGRSREGEGVRCRIVFSVKEATYKAFYPRLRVYWRFEDVGTEIDLDSGRFLATLPPSAGLPRIEGRVSCRDGWIVSGLAIRADETGQVG